MLNESEFFLLMDQQDMVIHKRMKENMRQVFEEEFVMSNICQKYMEYMMKNNTGETTYALDEHLKKNEIPVKKISDFDISRHDNSYTMYLHRHTYIELDYVYRGSCNYYIDNEDKVICLKEKELCIINQNVVHGIETFNKEDVIIKCMIPFGYIETEQGDLEEQETQINKFLSNSLNEIITKASYLIYHIRDYAGIDEILYQLFYEYVNKNTGWRHSIKNYLSLFFIKLMCIEETGNPIAVEIEEENLNITKILSCIQKNYQYITLKDLAKDMHFHENYLSRVIKQNLQMNFRDLLSQIRLKEAERMLVNTNLPIARIAVQVGYQKPNFFYKLFKEQYGVTPTQYRKSVISK